LQRYFKLHQKWCELLRGCGEACHLAVLFSVYLFSSEDDIQHQIQLSSVQKERSHGALHDSVHCSGT
jgi:hypothetical protein